MHEQQIDQQLIGYSPSILFASNSSRQEADPEKLQPELPQLPLPLTLTPLPPLPLLVV